MPIEMNFRSPHFIDTPSMTDIVKKGITDPIRQRAEQAQKDLLFQQQQEDRDRLNKEREAKELFYRELQAGPQTTYRDMDTVVKSLGLADPTMTPENMSVYDIDGKKYSTPTIAAGQQPLTEAQVAQRTAKQLELGGLLDKPENKVVETQPAMYERVLSSLADKGYGTAAFTEPLLQARATQRQSEKDALDAAEKQVLELETARRKNTADFYNALPKADIKELGTQSRTSVSSNKEAITNDYKKMSEAKKAGKLSLEDFDKWATETFENSLSGAPWRTDRDTKRDLIKYMYDNEISPNLAKDWLIANRQTGDLDNLEAIKVGILENSDRFKTTGGEGYVGGDTTATNTDAETRRLFGAVDPYGSVDALKAYYKTSDNELTARIKAAQDKVAQLKLSPEQREASRQAQYEKDIGELLKGVVPTMAAEEKQQTAVTSTANGDGKVPVKVMAAAGGGSGKGNGTPVTESSKRKKNEPVPALTLTTDEKAAILKDLKAAGVLTDKEKKQLEKWKKGLNHEMSDELAGPISDVLLGRLLKNTLDNPALLKNEPVVGPIVKGLSWARNKVDPYLPKLRVKQADLQSPVSSKLNLDAPTSTRNVIRGAHIPRAMTRPDEVIKGMPHNIKWESLDKIGARNILSWIEKNKYHDFTPGELARIRDIAK